MFKRRSLIAVLLLTITLVMTLAFPAGAAEGKVYWVSNEEQFISAANSSQDSDIIKLTNNITLSRPVKIKKSVNVDLQGHKLHGSPEYESKNNTKNNSNTEDNPFTGLTSVILGLIMFCVCDIILLCQVVEH